MDERDIRDKNLIRAIYLLKALLVEYQKAFDLSTSESHYIACVLHCDAIQLLEESLDVDSELSIKHRDQIFRQMSALLGQKIIIPVL